MKYPNQSTGYIRDLESRVFAQRADHEHEQRFMAHATAEMMAQRDRARNLAKFAGCVCAGLLAGLIYAGALLSAKPAPTVERCAADVLQLDPETIRAAKSGTVEI